MALTDATAVVPQQLCIQPGAAAQALKLVVLPGLVLLLASTARAALHIIPRGGEDAFWRSEATVLWLRRYDKVAMLLSMLILTVHRHKFLALFTRSSVAGGVPWLVPHCDVAFPAFVMMTVPVNVLLWLALSPQRFSLYRDEIMMAALVVRLLASAVAAVPEVCGESTFRQLLFHSGVARTTVEAEGTVQLDPEPLVLTLARISILHSGALYNLFHGVTCVLPSRRGVWLRVAAATLTVLAVPGAVRLTLEDAHASAALQGLCRASAGSLDVAMLFSWPSQSTCSPLVLEWLVSLIAISIGFMLPILVGSVIEYHAKRAFVAKARAQWREEETHGVQQQQQQQQQQTGAEEGLVSIGTPSAWFRVRLLLPLLQAFAIAVAITAERLLVFGLSPLPTAAVPPS